MNVVFEIRVDVKNQHCNLLAAKVWTFLGLSYADHHLVIDSKVQKYTENAGLTQHSGRLLLKTRLHGSWRGGYKVGGKPMGGFGE